MTRPHPALLIIVALIALFVLFLTWAGRQAATHGTAISDRGYYTAGLNYSNSQREREHAQQQGWHLRSHLQGYRLELTLLNASNQAVNGQTGLISLHLGNDRPLIQLPLRAQKGGRYLLELPARARGALTAELILGSRGIRLQQRLLLSLPQ